MPASSDEDVGGREESHQKDNEVAGAEQEEEQEGGDTTWLLEQNEWLLEQLESRDGQSVTRCSISFRNYCVSYFCSVFVFISPSEQIFSACERK